MSTFNKLMSFACVCACAVNVSWGNYGLAVWLGLMAVYYMADGIAEKL